MKYQIKIIVLLSIVIGSPIVKAQEMTSKNINVNGETLSYFDLGEGDTTLLFIHGAFTNKEYWKDQISYFSPKFRVLAMDLAGHGFSSSNRTTWTVEEYGKDVSLFIENLALKNVIIIGHSFGSDIMLETVNIVTSQIIGLIEVDHMKDLGNALPEETINYLVDNLTKNFEKTCEQYARQALITEQTSPQLTDKLLSDFRKMAPSVGSSLLNSNFNYTLREVELLKQLEHKLFLIHVNYLPTNKKSLSKFLGINYELHIMNGTCHYPMLENPQKFNKTVEKIIVKIDDI